MKTIAEQKLTGVKKYSLHGNSFMDSLHRAERDWLTRVWRQRHTHSFKQPGNRQGLRFILGPKSTGGSALGKRAVPTPGQCD